MSYVWRILTLLAQLATIGFYVQILSQKDLSVYLSHLAIATSLGAFVDFGFSQYCFRYLNRSSRVSSVIATALLANGAGMLLILIGLLPVTVLLSSVYKLHYGLLVLGLGGVMWNNLLYVNRHLCLLQGRIASCVLLDLFQPTFFLVALVAAWLLGRKGVSLTFAMFCLSNLGALLCGVFVARRPEGWRDAVGLAAQQALSLKDAPRLVRIMGRSVPLSVEQSLFLAFASLFIVLFDARGIAAAAASYGAFQRALGMSRSLLAVVLRQRMTIFYNIRRAGWFVVRFSCEAIAIGMLASIGAIAAHYGVMAWPRLASVNAIALLLNACQSWLAVGLIVGMEYLFYHTSYLLLGRNRTWARVWGNVIGCTVSALGAAAGVLWLGLDLRAALWIYAASLLATTLFLAAGSKERWRLFFTFPSPKELA